MSKSNDTKRNGKTDNVNESKFYWNSLGFDAFERYLPMYLEKSSKERTLCFPVGEFGDLLFIYIYLFVYFWYIFYEFSIRPTISSCTCDSILHTSLQWCMIGICRYVTVAHAYKCEMVLFVSLLISLHDAIHWRHCTRSEHTLGEWTHKHIRAPAHEYSGTA